jgi:hypothetical protein
MFGYEYWMAGNTQSGSYLFDALINDINTIIHSDMSLVDIKSTLELDMLSPFIPAMPNASRVAVNSAYTWKLRLLLTSSNDHDSKV